jgi:hypothetical protein
MLTWTSEKPTKSGWYWYRAQQLVYIAQIVLIEEQPNAELLMCIVGMDEKVPIPNGHWAGPLEAPV